MVGGVLIAVVGGLAVLAAARATTTDVTPGDNEADTDGQSGRRPPFNAARRPTNGSGGYNQCTHSGCKKKMDRRIIGHDCCGRCQTSRFQDCWEASLRLYDGPGRFPHDFFGTLLNPDTCADCGEPTEGHWVLDGGQTHVM
ncbi:hypothetical protein GT025_34060 [Streptomyces sp. SID4920]|nr:hypothetical protein [Streptomyces sp. SID4920]MYX68618.1 hypothetical protein [Streptomyces sp. SID8373]